MRPVLFTLALLAVAVAVAPGASATTMPGRNGPIAFATFTPCRTPCTDIQPTVRSVDPDGRRLRPLLHCPFGCEKRVHSLDWSPDARKLAMVGGDGDQAEVGVLDVRTGGLRTIPDVAAPGVEWSPRGDRLLFVHDDSLYTVRPDGRGRTRLATGQGVREAIWSPMGPIAFVDGRDLVPDDGWLSGGNVRVFDPKTGRVRIVARGGGPTGVDLIGWAPSGRLWVVDGDHGAVSMRPDGSGRRPTRRPTGSYAFAPDGRRFAVAELGSVWRETATLERERRLFRYRDDIVTSVAWARRPR